MKINIRNLNKRLASLALSLVMAGSTGFALAKQQYSNNNAKITTKIIKTVEEENHSIKEHKVAVITSKLDESGNDLKGAVLQILDLKRNVLDEWISDGTKHITMLSEGNYILHEKTAPKGYVLSDDKYFSVKVLVDDINAGVIHDDSPEVCWHYQGVALYYVESEGKKEEVYCINQGLDEPNNTNYDGLILSEKNIRLFAPDADPSMSNIELYNKILDIIYHRNIVKNRFPNLSDTAIRYITEYALKNYTSTMVNDGQLFRRYRYDPTVKTKYVEDYGNGNALGQLAKHWWYYHNKQTLPDIYAELYYYLISEKDPHPENMYLYVYSAQITSNEQKYQNLLGVKWFDPYDDYAVYLTNINKLKDPQKNYNIPKTGDDSHVLAWALAALGSSSLGIYIKNKEKVKQKKIN